MRRYILNSAVITAPGRYEYRLIDSATAAMWLTDAVEDGDGYLCTLGYAETCAVAKRLWPDHDFPQSREQVRFRPGDEGLVLRLKVRVVDPREKGRITSDPDSYEIGLLRMESGEGKE